MGWWKTKTEQMLEIARQRDCPCDAQRHKVAAECANRSGSENRDTAAFTDNAAFKTIGVFLNY